MRAKMENITADKLLLALGVVLTLLGAYNTIASARKNMRDEHTRQQAPTDALVSSVHEINRKLDTDKHRLDSHESRLSGLRDGLMVTCAGVQALLEHELHNGNATEMQAASKEIDIWLRKNALKGE